MTKMETQALEEAAEILLSARTGAAPLDRLPEHLQPTTLEDGYAIQDALNAKLGQAGFGEKVGYKIGCTSSVMQTYLGVPHPCAGAMFQATVMQDAGRFDRSKLCRPGVECEIAVQIGKDMQADRPFTREDCDAYVRSAMASIELVDDRWTDFKAVPAPAFISENFFNAGCVLGAPAEASGEALAVASGSMRINGEVVGSGTGADILGHPFEALAWLANHQMQRGAPLKAGDYVTLGSVIQTQWIDSPALVEVEFTGLGRCELHLA